MFQDTCDLQCELSFRTLKIQMGKMWFYSHVAGWFAKVGAVDVKIDVDFQMCIFRDWNFCLLLSAAFETVELSFQWLVPEFQVRVSIIIWLSSSELLFPWLIRLLFYPIVWSLIDFFFITLFDHWLISFLSHCLILGMLVGFCDSRFSFE